MDNESAVECSISLTFVTDFDHLTPDLQQTFKVKGSRYQRSRSQHDI